METEDLINFPGPSGSEHGGVNEALSGVKRPRISVDDQEPSVHVIYNSLTRDSKRKLEELLQQWSQWHSQNCSSSNDSKSVLESGKETYFPAIRIGLDKPSSVSFWVDNEIKNQSIQELKPLDATSVPLYDRGFSIALTSSDVSNNLDGGAGKLNTSRCFNCGSYSHALKDCPKPRDHVAVNNARKEHNSKRNEHSNSRNSTRYYQNSRGGKYDDLIPGVLDAETRQMLGLKELDPPPWLNRMREIGYPPGYLEAENQPSGITIFGDETHNQETEGEILDPSYTINPSLKMSVEFPGINAPIPENADKRLWEPSPPSNLTPISIRDYDHSPKGINNRQYYYQDNRRTTDFEDGGSPRWAPGAGPTWSSRLHYNYGDYASNYSILSPQASSSIPWSHNFSRSLSDRGGRSPLFWDGSPSYGGYGAFPHSYPR